MLRHDHPMMQTFRHMREQSNWAQRMKAEREEGYRTALEEIMCGSTFDEIEKMEKTIADLKAAMEGLEGRTWSLAISLAVECVQRCIDEDLNVFDVVEELKALEAPHEPQKN